MNDTMTPPSFDATILNRPLPPLWNESGTQLFTGLEHELGPNQTNTSTFDDQHLNPTVVISNVTAPNTNHNNDTTEPKFNLRSSYGPAPTPTPSCCAAMDCQKTKQLPDQLGVLKMDFLHTNFIWQQSKLMTDIINEITPTIRSFLADNHLKAGTKKTTITLAPLPAEDGCSAGPSGTVTLELNGTTSAAQRDELAAQFNENLHTANNNYHTNYMWKALEYTGIAVVGVASLFAAWTGYNYCRKDNKPTARHQDTNIQAPLIADNFNDGVAAAEVVGACCQLAIECCRAGASSCPDL